MKLKTNDFHFKQLHPKASPLKTSTSIVAILILAAVASQSLAQEYQHFSLVDVNVTGTIGWDSFTASDPNNYMGPHAADVIESNSTGSIISASAGGFKAGPNLYAFLSTPTWTVGLNGLTDTEQFTSVGIQVATTPPPAGADLDMSSFLLNGAGADEFISLGTRTTLDAGGGQPPQDVNYYWAAWNGLSASSNYSITVGPGANHVVFAGARVDYLNSSTVQNLSVVPEPGAAFALALAGLPFLRRRRNKFV